MPFNPDDEARVNISRSVAQFEIGGRRAALQFSGGKDSMACLYLLREEVERGMPVYWLDSGDGIPETLEVVDEVRQWIPDFRPVEFDYVAWIEANGSASDITTAHSSYLGQELGLSDLKLSGRFASTWHTLMLPLHQRVVEDGIEVVVRGTKSADADSLPHLSGDAYDVMMPLDGWTHDDVFSYLQHVGAPISKVYDYCSKASAPEWLHDTAWWDDGKARYLKAKHPDLAERYRLHLHAVRDEVHARLRELQAELDVLEGRA